MIDFEKHSNTILGKIMMGGAHAEVEQALRQLAADVLEEAADETCETAAAVAAHGVLNPDHAAEFSAASNALIESAESLRTRAKEIMAP